MKTLSIIIATLLIMTAGCCQMQVAQRDLPGGGTETTVTGSWRTLKIYTSAPSAVMIEAE